MRGLVAISALMAGGAAAQPIAAPPAPKVSELVVPGGPQPKVTATWPAQGASVSAGDVAIKVVFDRPMAAARWSFAPVEGAAFPVCLARPRLLSDKKTFVLLCQVKPRASYAVSLGGPPGFLAEAGRETAPLVLKFETGDEIVDNLHDALDQAGLTDADEPIMTWNDDGKTPPTSPPPPGA
jgi:hypothetical protein